ncbi:hypothetical protein GCK72_009457 [Caenorhabditis remanei]|uniref:Uncharacterized protein n=2 Tax=Caenorhabditis remanei TaxID=31234 RepID=E3LSD2_CAERE|nr:hypothetical protein GCK72_009457 [Caenorhabditis remanei]EFP09202.1 hypothetical protein CRE_25571 [Caenorhabditis remanei]KAF1761203.1 hypothetical protein GCK72_009457 [Caenorhabditis remanei]
MISNKLLVANLMIGVTILVQGLVPMSHVSKFDGFWMFSAALVCLVIAVISFIGLLILSRSKCMLTMSKMKLAIYNSPAAVSSLLSLIFFIVYAFVPVSSTEHVAIQNSLLLLVVGLALITISSLVVILLALLSNPEYPSEQGSDNDD